jgi:hypothetical protein
MTRESIRTYFLMTGNQLNGIGAGKQVPENQLVRSPVRRYVRTSPHARFARAANGDRV